MLELIKKYSSGGEEALFHVSVSFIRASLVAQLVRNLPAMQETPV